MVPDSTYPNSKFRPVKIHHYLKVSLCFEEKIENICLASVQWLKPHLDKNALGNPAQIWTNNNFEIGTKYAFIPIDCLECRCSYFEKTHNNDSVLIVVPLTAE